MEFHRIRPCLCDVLAQHHDFEPFTSCCLYGRDSAYG